MEKLIITAAITGAELSKKECPVLPTTPEEQAAAALECMNAGASVIHLHVRGQKGEPSQELKDFERSLSAIRKACGPELILQISTGGAVGERIERRIAPLSLKPDMGSLNLGTINFGEEIFVNTFEDMRKLSSAFTAQGVVPEYEIYEAGHVDNLRKLIKEKVVAPPFHCQFVLGVAGALAGEISSLVYLAEHLPLDTSWAVAGIGRYELPLAVHAILMGGHVRVGLEDNIYYSKGVPAKSNAQLVERITRLAKELGREVASTKEARKILGLPTQ